MKAVNLLPPDLSGAPKASAALSADTDAPRGPGAFVLLGALALAVLALTGYVLTNNTLEERESELAQLAARQQAAEQRAAALKPYAEFEQLAQGRLATLRDLAGQRFDWDQTLRDLSRALPRNVTVKSIDGSLSAPEGSGAATTQESTGGPSMTLEGCTRSQSAVARLMARVRDMNGVTAVTLASSKKARTESSETPDASSASQAPCGAGYLPDFKVLVSYEEAAAGAQGTAGQASAASTASTQSTSTQGGTQ